LAPTGNDVATGIGQDVRLAETDMRSTPPALSRIAIAHRGAPSIGRSSTDASRAVNGSVAPKQSCCVSVTPLSSVWSA